VAASVPPLADSGSPAVGPHEADGQAGPEVPGGGPAAVSALSETPPQAQFPAEEEESLLERTEADVEDAVIGEEAGVTPPARTPGSSPTPAKEPDPKTVSVRISSRPDGAVIRLKNRIFGRAPMNLRFRSGLTYELSFVKSGYVTATRRFTVTGKGNQTVAVALSKKAPPKKRGFLDRLFGR
jgi:hypothetical protein